MQLLARMERYSLVTVAFEGPGITLYLEIVRVFGGFIQVLQCHVKYSIPVEVMFWLWRAGLMPWLW